MHLLGLTYTFVDFNNYSYLGLILLWDIVVSLRFVSQIHRYTYITGREDYH
jgi:hypothetical protein